MILYDYDREDWLYSTTPPITGPSFNSKDLKYFCIHWTGSPGNVSKNEIQVLNNIQIDYQNNRGYSFGYSSAVGLSGSTYEGRGVDFKSASNGDDSNLDDDIPGNPGIQDNLEVFGCLLILSQADQITDEMIDGVQRLYTQVTNHLGRELTINGHNDMDFTACPGPQAQALIDSNSFYPIKEENNTMNVLDNPIRVFDTRTTDYTINGLQTGRAPVGPGTFDFDVETNAFQIVATVTAIPQTVEPGFIGSNDKDSFINWPAGNLYNPFPQTVPMKVINGKVRMHLTQSCHLILSIRAE